MGFLRCTCDNCKTTGKGLRYVTNLAKHVRPSLRTSMKLVLASWDFMMLPKLLIIPYICLISFNCFSHAVASNIFPNSSDLEGNGSEL